MSNNIPSPMSLDLTNTRAFKIWLYQLWQTTGGTTSTATDDADIYLADFKIASETSQVEQSILLQIRDELTEINKKLDEIKINERTVLDDISRKFDDVIILLGSTL